MVRKKPSEKSVRLLFKMNETKQTVDQAVRFALKKTRARTRIRRIKTKRQVDKL